MSIDFETLFARSPNPYVILDPDLIMVWMNEAYLRATMRERDDLVGRRIFNAFPSDPDSDSFRLLNNSFREVIATGEPDEIALIRYDIARPDGGMDVRYWSATHTPLKDAGGKLRYILQHTVDVTELHNLRRLRDEMGVVRRASAVQARNRDLAAESRRLLDFFEQAPGFVAVISGPGHRFEMVNEAYRDLVGRSDLLGRPVRDALPEVVDQGFVVILDTVFATGEPYVGHREKVFLRRKDSQEGVDRFLNFIFQPVFDERDIVTGIIIQGYDVTEEVEYEERQTLLINELNHRVKNTLAIVQGLAGQSFRSVEAASDARKIFDDRLKALAAAHNLLTERNWGSATLSDIVTRSAAATAGSLMDRVEIAGPDILLQPQTAVSLAMVIHELCTNAIKYGALSGENGKVAIHWEHLGPTAERMLCLKWRESGGPRVEEPQSRGFGTRLIERGLSSDSSGKVRMQFKPAGLECTIETRLSAQQL